MLAMVALAAPEAPGTPNPGTETFTNIITNGHLGFDYPFLDKPTPNAPVTVTSPEHLANTHPAYAPGSLDGEGTATFGTLQSRIKLWGPAALNAASRSLFNDHWTVLNSLLTGEVGTMQLAFDLSGMTTVLDTSSNPVATDEYSSMNLIVDLNPSTSNNGTRVLDFSTSLFPGPTQINATPNGPTVTIPFNFTYGSEFGIRTALSVYASTDNFYISHLDDYGGGSIGSVTVDFLSTAELIGIVIPDDADALVRGSSLVNYSGLVMTEVPAPAALWLMLAGIPFLRGRRRRTRSA